MIIISRHQSLEILEKGLRKTALDEHAEQLKRATPERRREIMAQIDRNVRKELRRRLMTDQPVTVLYCHMICGRRLNEVGIPCDCPDAQALIPIRGDCVMTKPPAGSWHERFAA